MNVARIHPYPSVVESNLIKKSKVYNNIADYYTYLNSKKKDGLLIDKNKISSKIKKTKIEKTKIEKTKMKKTKKINPFMEKDTLPIIPITKTIAAETTKPILTKKQEWTDEYISDDDPDEYNF